MFELTALTSKTYYIESPAKIGVWCPDGVHAWFIDSGNDKDAGRKLRKILDQQGWQLQGILNTHSNADHIGGNQYLQRQTGCRVFAGGLEKAFTSYPILEPSFLYGGYPMKDLRHKFLMAKESDVTDFSDSSFPHEIEIISLPGHFFHMVGFRTPDNVVFLADCLNSRVILDKYALGYIYDVQAYLDTLDKVEAMEADWFVPAHAEATQDIRPLVQYNKQKVQEIAGLILQLCQAPRSWDDILQSVLDHYHLTLTVEQYVLIGNTIRSFLSWLRDTDKVTILIENNRLLWQAI
ncbi:MBL fold metallo-hydrolase [uncultured Megasphaera sp.]|uniref:MBL fold metallo-hydrolase n=1 Tax=uncultured Megasphaera sp. TaxID=165188 RepID=UPI0025FC9E1D|nr:MBL fold metallo-hydrolase [uncultured Megasphaera sp.]